MKAGRADGIRVVEWRMLDKRRFYPNSVTCSFFSQCVIYPNTLIRTRLQMQRGNDLYSGTFDAYKKILRTEGFRGLYRGFWVSSFQVVHGVCYVTVYECVRHFLGSIGVKNTEAKAMIGGSCAAVVGETIIVPCDVISQHLMMSGLSNTGSKQKRVASEVIRSGQSTSWTDCEDFIAATRPACQHSFHPAHSGGPSTTFTRRLEPQFFQIISPT